MGMCMMRSPVCLSSHLLHVKYTAKFCCCSPLPVLVLEFRSRTFHFMCVHTFSSLFRVAD